MKTELNWMRLPKEYTNGRFLILPIAYEKDVTYGEGAAKGAEEIIRASEHLEYYDEQFDCEPFLQGIGLAETITAEIPEEMIDKVAEKIVRTKDKFVIGLGGDHSITIGLVKGHEKILSEEGEEFSVIQFDAHADFRDFWNNSTLNHACVAKQVSKKHDLVLIGIRSMDIDEKKQIELHNQEIPESQKNQDGKEDQEEKHNVYLIKAYDYSLEKLKEILPRLKDKIYITIDVDVFDPSFIRNTGTPEPGGLNWQEVIEVLKLIFQHKKVIGVDITEFAPDENKEYKSEAYSLAKLVYKIMALQSF